MEFVAAQVLNGLVIGLLYALMAVGLSLIFSVLKLVNFAHGECYMMGGFISYYLATLFGLNPVLSVFLAMIGVFLIGVAIQYLLLRPIYTGAVERKSEYAILITFGLGIFLQNLAMSVFGPWTKRSPDFLPGTTLLGFLTVDNNRLVVSAAAILIVTALLIIIGKTFVGKALRAVSQDRDAAAIVGINSHRMNLLAFGIGVALAGGAGALIGPIFLISPVMGILPGIKSFVIIVLGGMGSIKGAIIGSLLLGQMESLGSVFLLDPTRGLAYKNAFGVLLLAIILLLKPTGLFGEKFKRLE
ncbi:TPA: branched-chain amino acid ABC transporter permease [Candidatus Bipolaricaulota bacterium]|nr:branched-chain amino acid ABC transporter permease [Candidatus Bipolaricaulota bacterium]